MFSGHFGLATAIKAKEPELPLIILFIATQLLDILFLLLWFFKIETLDKIGAGGYGEQIIHANYTHSLIGSLLISIISGYIVSQIWSRKAGFVFGATVFSHWLLDLVVHCMDMPILPGNIGNLPLLGFGVWRYPEISKVIEIAIVIFGLIFYSKCFIGKNKDSKLSNKLSLSVTVTLLILLVVMTIIGN